MITITRRHQCEDKNTPVIGIGIIVEDTPLYFDCMNDAASPWRGLNFAKYCKYATEAVNFTTNVAAYEFPLWVTRNFTSVDDVQEALKNVTIVGKPINDRFPVATLHWIIADNTRSIVVECTEDGMHVYDDDVDVLTNQSPFPQQIEHLDNYAYVSPRTGKSVKWGSSELETNQDSNSSQGLPGGYGSMARFVRAAYNNTHYPTQSGENANVNRLFKTLSTAAVIEGTAISANGEFEKTLFSDCYSTATQTVYLKKYDDMPCIPMPSRISTPPRTSCRASERGRQRTPFGNDCLVDWDNTYSGPAHAWVPISMPRKDRGTACSRNCIGR